MKPYDCFCYLGTLTVLRMSLIILINTVGAPNQVSLPAFDIIKTMGLVEQNHHKCKVGARGL